MWHRMRISQNKGCRGTGPRAFKIGILRDVQKVYIPFFYKKLTCEACCPLLMYRP